MTVRRVFAEPYEKNGVTIIPGAMVSGGGGGGGGHDDKGQEGEGGGFGMNARPVGAFVIKNGGVTWRPAVDVNRMLLVVGAVVIASVLSRARSMRQQRRGLPRGFMMRGRMPSGIRGRMMRGGMMSGMMRGRMMRGGMGGMMPGGMRGRMMRGGMPGGMGGMMRLPRGETKRGGMTRGGMRGGMMRGAMERGQGGGSLLHPDRITLARMARQFVAGMDTPSRSMMDNGMRGRAGRR